MIRIDHRADIGFLTLARPDARNALTPTMLRDLAASAADLGSRSRAILLAGEGAAFCAGFDLNLCRDDPSGDTLRSLLRGLSDAILSLRNQPAPVIACVQGAAVAGGCALLGGADIVIASAEARLGYPVTKLGISPSVSTPFLFSSVDAGPTRSLQLDPGLISTAEGHRIGLVGEVLPDPAAALARATQIASEIGSKPPQAISATRRLLQELTGPTDALASVGLARSLGLVGGPEERVLLPKAWAGRS
jgi:enoyl-CoA hydratase/carnithine racemase